MTQIDMTPKVFGIGFQKTGTTTLGVILNKLGYRTAGYHEFRHLADKDDLRLQDLEELALKLASEYDAFKDTPWPLFYEILDKTYPGSKFIHVTRDSNAWIRSAVSDFGSAPNALHRVIYDVAYPAGNEEKWLERYNRHNADVRAYFANRPEDCLFLDLGEGISVEKICVFLGRPLVDISVPKSNTRIKKRLKMLLRRIKKKLFGDFT